jgi:hypothetical protein
MSYKIGGLSFQEYQHLLLKPSKPRTSPHWIAPFNLAACSSLAIYINRFVYFLLHQMACYPSTAYLFQKFKSHDFTRIETKGQLDKVEELYEQFSRCISLKPNEKQHFDDSIQAARARIVPGKDFTEDPVRKDEGAAVDQESADGTDKGEQESSLETKSGDPSKRDADEVLDEGPSEEKPDPVETSDAEARKARRAAHRLEAKRLEEEQKKAASPTATAAPSDDGKVDLEALPDILDDDDLSAAPPLDDGSNVFEPKKIIEETESDNSFSWSDAALTLNQQEAIARWNNKRGSTWKSVTVIVDPAAASGRHQVKDSSKQLIDPLPRDIETVIMTRFPLGASQAIGELYQPGNEQERSEYRQNLRKLANYGRDLEASGNKPDLRFEAYMKKIDQAFQLEFDAAIKEVDSVHAEFSAVFQAKLPEKRDNGEVLCTAEQMDWVAALISTRYRALYELSIDAAVVNIFETDQMAQFARKIFFGSSDDEDVASICFIRLRETEGKKTPPVEKKGIENTLVQDGSYLFTQVFGKSHGVEMRDSAVKAKLSNISSGYVRNWLQKMGWAIEWKDVQARSGWYLNGVKASEWAGAVRDSYTNTLLGMSPVELEKEVVSTLNSPLINMVVRAYRQDAAHADWEKSSFPSAILEKIFSEQSRLATKTPLQPQIQQLIGEAHFADPDVIRQLADTAGCAPSLVEPLIRIKILYLLCCMGVDDSQSALEGVGNRVASMADLALGPVDQKLMTLVGSSERKWVFDDRFDRMEQFVDSAFESKASGQMVAQGVSTFNVSSLNTCEQDSLETSVVDLGDLRFSIYATPSYRRYLTAQVNPQVVVDEIKTFETSVKSLGIHQTVKQYRRAEKEVDDYNQTLYFFNTKKVFDPSSCRDETRDQPLIDAALALLKGWPALLNTYYVLSYEDQLTSQQDQEIADSVKKIRASFADAMDILDDIYGQSKITEKIAEIRRIIELDESALGFSEAQVESPRRASRTFEDVVIEPDVGPDTQNSLKPKQNKLESSSMVGSLINALTPSRQDPDVIKAQKYFRWKIGRYADLIKGAQQAVQDYLTKNQFGSINELLHDSKTAAAPQWQRQIQPILEFCNCEDFHGHPSAATLDLVKDQYQEFFDHLRKAVAWAKDHLQEPGVEHIHGICHFLYTSIDAREPYRKMFEQMMGDEEDIELHRGDILDELRVTSKAIADHPIETDAPLIREWMAGVQQKSGGFWPHAALDPNRQANPVHSLMHVNLTHQDGKVQAVNRIALGTPTIESGNGQAAIAPEFEGFLRHCKAKGQVHVSLNNQDLRDDSFIEGHNGAARSHALHDLAEQEFKDTLHVLTLGTRSPFYKQTGYDFTNLTVTSQGVHSHAILDVAEVKKRVLLQLIGTDSSPMNAFLPKQLRSDPGFHQWMAAKLDEIADEEVTGDTFLDEEDREDFLIRFHEELRAHVDLLKLPSGELGYSAYDRSAARFKDELRAQHFDLDPKASGNRIPQDLVLKCNLRNWSKTLADQLHETLFGGRDELKINERRIFIRLFHHQLLHKVLVETNATSCNVTDRDGVDASAAFNAEDHAYIALLNDKISQHQTHDFMKELVFARAVFLRRRAMDKESLDGLFKTVRFMMQKQSDLKNLQEKLFPGLQMSLDHF